MTDTPRVTATISDLKSKGQKTKWRGPIGTPDEKQAACVWALKNMGSKVIYHAATIADQMMAQGRLRALRATNDHPIIDCQRRVGYWLLSFHV